MVILLLTPNNKLGFMGDRMETKGRAKTQHFVRIAGLNQVYEPHQTDPSVGQKHRCRDCHFCQFCSDARCHACRNRETASGKGCKVKLSIREQIAYYDELNRHNRNS